MLRGICVDRNRTVTCVSTFYGTTPETANATLLLPADRTSAGISYLSIAIDLQAKLFICLGAAAAALFWVSLILLAINVFAHKRNEGLVGSEPGRWRRLLDKVTLPAFILSTALSLSAAVSVSYAGNVLEYASFVIGGGNGSIVMSAGKTLQALQWLAFGISVIFNFVLILWTRRYGEHPPLAFKHPNWLPPPPALPPPQFPPPPPFLPPPPSLPPPPWPA